MQIIIVPRKQLYLVITLAKLRNRLVVVLVSF